MLHFLSPSDFSRVARSEGVDIPIVGARIKDVSVLVDGITVPAKAFVFPGGAIWGRPSRRYLQLAVEGALFWGMQTFYVNELRAIPIQKGLFGGFGLFVEPRPHLLDRPNPNLTFGLHTSEMYSPWKAIKAGYAVEKFEEEQLGTHGFNLRLVHLSNVSQEKRPTKRPMYFIPGIDGTGKSILSQVGDLDKEGIYDVSTLVYPYSNRQSFVDLASDLIDLVYQDAHDRPVSLVAESMGGVLSIFVACENSRRRREEPHLPSLNIDLLLLVNPATCYSRSDPKDLWDFLLSLGLGPEWYAGLLPSVLLPFVIDLNSARSNLGPNMVPRLRNILFSLTRVSEVLPQDALSWRLRLLAEYEISAEQFAALSGKDGPDHVALISSINDNLLPSHSESHRLRRYIPKLYSMLLSYGGHSPMFDTRFSLSNFLRPFNKVEGRNQNEETKKPTAETLKRRAALRKRFARIPSDRKDDAKSHEDIGVLSDFLAKSWKDMSPVFIGEENIPKYKTDKPVLFVCNHTLLGWLDALHPIERILSTRKILVRSLAHPQLMSLTEVSFPYTPKVTADDLRKYGILQVSPRQLVEQLGRGRWMLLFPGGAREALKKPGAEKYTVKWPEKAEFIRTCALFGATVVPMSTVGTEDSLRLLLGSDSMAKIFEQGSKLMGQEIDWSMMKDNARRWQGKKDGEVKDVIFPPFGIPTKADRLYFKFGKGIEISDECLRDSALEKKTYDEIQQQVKEGVSILLRRREADEFRSIESRREYERKYGNNVSPPAGRGWAWMQHGAYLDDDVQPPI